MTKCETIQTKQSKKNYTWMYMLKQIWQTATTELHASDLEQTYIECDGVLSCLLPNPLIKSVETQYKKKNLKSARNGLTFRICKRHKNIKKTNRSKKIMSYWKQVQSQIKLINTVYFWILRYQPVHIQHILMTSWVHVQPFYNHSHIKQKGFNC